MGRRLSTLGIALVAVLTMFAAQLAAAQEATPVDLIDDTPTETPTLEPTEPAFSAAAVTDVTTDYISISVNEGSIAYDGTFSVDIYWNIIKGEDELGDDVWPVAGTTYTLAWPSNVIGPATTFTKYDPWADSSVPAYTVTSTATEVTFTLTDEIIPLLYAHPGWPDYDTRIDVEGLTFVDQASLAGTTQTVTFADIPGGPFSDTVNISGLPSYEFYDIYVNEGSIDYDETFSLHIWWAFIQGGNNGWPTAGTTYTLAWPSNIIGPETTFTFYNIWGDPDIPAYTVTSTATDITFTITQDVVDLVEANGWSDYDTWFDLEGFSFVDQASLAGTTQTVSFPDVPGGPHTDTVNIGEGPGRVDWRSIYAVEGSIDSVGEDSTFTTHFDLRLLAPYNEAGATYTIAWPSNVVGPTGSYTINDVWWDSSQTVYDVTSTATEVTFTVRQELIDLVESHGSPYFEYIATINIPGSKFVDQTSLAGTTQDVVWNASDGDTFDDRISIGELPEDPTWEFFSISIDEGSIDWDGDFTANIYWTFTKGNGHGTGDVWPTAGTTYTLPWPDNVIGPETTFTKYNPWGDNSIPAYTVTSTATEVTFTLTQDVVDLVNSHPEWPDYDTRILVPGVTFVDQPTLAGTTQDVVFANLPGGTFTDRVSIGDLPESGLFTRIYVEESSIPNDGTFTTNFTTRVFDPYPAVGSTYSIAWPDNVIGPDTTVDIYDVWWDRSVKVGTATSTADSVTITIEQGLEDLVYAHGSPYFEYYSFFEIPGAQFVDQAALGGTTQPTIFTSDDATFEDAVFIEAAEPTPTPDLTATAIATQTVTATETPDATATALATQTVTATETPDATATSIAATQTATAQVPDATATSIAATQTAAAQTPDATATAIAATQTATAQVPDATATSIAATQTAAAQTPDATATAIAQAPVVIYLVTTDGNDVPDDTLVCVDTQCTTVGGAEISAAAASGVSVTFSNLAPGTYSVTVTNAAPYADASGSVTVNEDGTGQVTITLVLSDEPAATATSIAATQTAAAQTPDPTATSIAATQTAAAQTPGQATPIGQATTTPGGSTAGSTTTGPTVSSLPKTGVGQEQSSLPWIVFSTMAALALVVIVTISRRRRI